MSEIETYDSDDLRVACLDDKKGKLTYMTTGHLSMQCTRVCSSGIMLKSPF